MHKEMKQLKLIDRLTPLWKFIKKFWCTQNCLGNTEILDITSPDITVMSTFSIMPVGHLSESSFNRTLIEKLFYRCMNTLDATHHFTHSLGAIWTIPCRTWIIHVCFSNRWFMAFLMIQGVALNTLH